MSRYNSSLCGDLLRSGQLGFHYWQRQRPFFLRWFPQTRTVADLLAPYSVDTEGLSPVYEVAWSCSWPLASTQYRTREWLSPRVRISVLSQRLHGPVLYVLKLNVTIFTLAWSLFCLYALLTVFDNVSLHRNTAKSTVFLVIYYFYKPFRYKSEAWVHMCVYFNCCHPLYRCFRLQSGEL
jgi:hypothetical protein